MIIKIVVAGSREYTNYNEAKKFIDKCLSRIRENNEIVIISGGARGADALGERYAKENNLKIEQYHADWETYGRSAGPIRNKIMAQNCNYVICFWDGKSRGTKTMIEYAKQYNKEIRIKFI